MKKNHLIELLRTEANGGKKVHDLVKIIQDQNEPANFNSFTAIGFFMQAFNLKLSQVREISGAECVGGAVYTNDEIDKIIMPHINSALELLRSTNNI